MRGGCLLLVLLLCSCAGPGVPPATGGSPCRGLQAPEPVGQVGEPDLDEVSGLAVSRRHPGILWVHNDSDAAARLWALDTAGRVVATLDLGGAEAVDWEDAALGPGPGGDHLYVADTGDNLRARPYSVLYRVAEPAGLSGALGVEAQALRVTFPGGPRDVEAMFVDPATGDVYLIAKVLLSPAPLYVVPAEAWAAGETTAAQVGSLDLGLLPATAADVAPDGSVVAVRTYAAVLLFARPPGGTLAAALASRPCAAPAPPEAQGEAIGWDGGGYLTVGEGSAAPIYRVSLSPDG